MKEDSPFDNRIQAALRIGDMKLITGSPIGGLSLEPVYTDGKYYMINCTTVPNIVTDCTYRV